MTDLRNENHITPDYFDHDLGQPERSKQRQLRR